MRQKTTPWNESYNKLGELKKSRRQKPFSERQQEWKEIYQKGFRLRPKEGETPIVYQSLRKRVETDRAREDLELSQELREVWE